VVSRGRPARPRPLARSPPRGRSPRLPEPAGFGGTAARPGRALLPWAGALAAGLVLTLAGGLALRRRHIASHAAR